MGIFFSLPGRPAAANGIARPPASAANPGATARTRGTKRGLLDYAASPYLRLFSAAGIVWYHISTDNFVFHSWGSIGLALFLVLAFLQPGQPRSIGVVIKASWQRLFIPYAAWWFVYAAVSVWRARGLPPELAGAHSFWIFLVWPSLHLWFLPFLFFATIGVRYARLVTAAFNSPVKVCLALAAALCVLLTAPFLRTSNLSDLYWVSLPGVGLGLAYGYLQRLDRRTQTRGFVAISVLVALASVPCWLWGRPTVAIGYTGTALAMILCTMDLPRYRVLSRLSRLTLGIYLAHPLVANILIKVFGGDAFTSILALNVLALTTFLLAGLMTWAMLQTPYLRNMV